MLEIRGVTKVYDAGGVKHKALDRVTLNFRMSEFVAILGPSGSGKTTLLNIIGGLDHYTSGDLKINEVSTKNFRDKDWDAYRNHRIGFVFQAYNLIPHQTVLSNVKLALTLSGISKREAVRRARKALEAVGLKDHINKKPSQLSGGQMQRVAIARALVNDPDILLADEPTGALDSDTSVQIMELLKNIAKEKLVVMVTHNPELADEYANRIITLKDGKITSDSRAYDGKIKTNLDHAEVDKRERRTRMSFLTALGLSLKNLLTKKGRTVLVAFAGSIGIIGIALILAVSTGFQSYIDAIEHDTLTSYPLALMKESTNVTGILLNLAGPGSGEAAADGKVRENQVLTSSLGNVAQNDLPSFMNYYDSHKEELKDDVRLVEYEYNIDPLIYTVDATGALAKLNPSSLFSTLMGSGSLLNSYSGLTSAFRQYELANLQSDTEILAGRYPEKYDEMVVYLSNKGEISEFLTYSLGFHDTKELSNIIKSIMGGESVNIKNDPLELTYDDLMSVDLRMMLPAETYKYNEKYDVYEDMSGDEAYMRDLYDNHSVPLKIVGVVTGKDGLMSSGSGVYYLPSLTKYIIGESAKTEIVKKQLSEPTIDIFSNTKFGEKNTSFNFGFSDLVSVDEAKLGSAIRMDLDQNAVSAKTQEYMTEIGNDITADVSPVVDVLTARLDELHKAFLAWLALESAKPDFDASKMDEYVANFVAKQDFGDLEAKYLIPAASFADAFTGLLKLKMAGTVMPNADELIKTTIQTFAIKITEVVMKSEILTKVGNLTAYLTSSFADAFGINSDALLGAFTLNFTQDELTRVISAMFDEKDATFNTNLALLGYQELDDPMEVAFYFSSFDGKTHFMEFLDKYNDLMREYEQDKKVIEYSDTTGLLMSSVKTIVDAVSYVLIAFVSISLIVSSIMIGIITYISVYERTKEIGILRAIGASKRNISSIFNAETFIVGLLSGLFGITISYLLIPVINSVMHAFTGDIPLNARLTPVSALILIIISVVLTLIGGLIPAKSASKKDPVEALRSE